MMNQLEPLQVGVMFWTGGDLGVEGTPFEIVQMVKGLGVDCGQLGIHPDANLTPAAVETWSQALERLNFTITAVFPAFRGGELRRYSHRSEDGWLRPSRYSRRA